MSFSDRSNPTGIVDASTWLSSTRSVPPDSPTGIGSSRRSKSDRKSSRMCSALRAVKPSSGWCRLASSSETTTRGMTMLCSANLSSAPGSERSTEVSRTYVWTFSAMGTPVAYVAPRSES
ncbi:Uncharacterised protein [Mycobacteroides abscessus subsp. abscessus]|nr:Uncharacterised protein [Mycobacteroides abscessus subsp. abscessus]